VKITGHTTDERSFNRKTNPDKDHKRNGYKNKERRSNKRNSKHFHGKRRYVTNVEY